MNDAIKIAKAIPVIIEIAQRETDLSLVELSAVFRSAAEACAQTQIVQELMNSIIKSRGRP